MKKSIAFLITLVMLCSITVSAHPFTDVGGHWAEPQLEIAYQSGMINGDPDGRFRPDDNISRAEYLKMLTAVTSTWLEIPASRIDSYADDTHWASKYYNFAMYQGWVINYTYDFVDPEFESFISDVRVGDIIPGNMSTADFDIPIQRWEMAYLASRFAHSVCGTAMSKKAQTGYADYDKIKATYPALVLDHLSCSFGAGIMTGDESGKLNAENNGTRAEAAVMINRYLNLIDTMYKAIPDTNKTYTQIPTGHPVAQITFSDDRVLELELYPEYAPQTVANFVALANSGFYNEETDVNGVNKANYPTVGSLCTFSNIKSAENTVYGEFAKNGYTQNTLPMVAGTAVLDHMWSNNDGSANFRILVEDMPEMSGSAAPFGKVISGMDILLELVKDSSFAIVKSIVIK